MGAKTARPNTSIKSAYIRYLSEREMLGRRASLLGELAEPPQL
jgi:hypothetical protein